MSDDAMSLFGVRAPGEPGFYRQNADFLVLVPELLTKGAVFAADPSSWVHAWLVQYSGVPKEKLGPMVRDTLVYMLTVVEACRSADLSEVFDESRVNPYAYQAVMMGFGCVGMRRFNKLFRESRFTDLQSRGVTEPTAHVDHNAALRMFDTLLAKVTQS